MFSSSVLEAAIGLAFVYLLLSLVVSAASEFLSRLAGLRASTLRAWFEQLEQPPSDRDGRRVGGGLWATLAALVTGAVSRPHPAPSEGAGDLYAHPLIQAMKNGAADPSYIDADTFAAVVLDKALAGRPAQRRVRVTSLEGVVAESSLPQSLKDAVLAQLRLADGDVAAARKALADWFDSAMTRVSGWYKRRMQTITLLLGLLVVVLVGADTFTVANALWRSESVRAVAVDAAGSYLSAHGAPSSPAAATPGRPPAASGPAPATPAAPAGPTPGRPPAAPAAGPGAGTADASSAASEALGALRDLNLPLFWHADQQCRAFGTVLFETGPRAGGGAPSPCPSFSLGRLLWFVVGLLVSAVAVSFGARFWFDVLSKLVNVRASGERPGRAAGVRARAS